MGLAPAKAASERTLPCCEYEARMIAAVTVSTPGMSRIPGAISWISSANARWLSSSSAPRMMLRVGSYTFSDGKSGCLGFKPAAR